MSNRLHREANRAHKQEVRAERKEERLHDRAVNAALHGNIGRAIRLENKSHNAGHRAEAAHHREMDARHAANSMHHHRHHQPPIVFVPPPVHHHHPPPHHHHPPPHCHQPAPPPRVEVHHHHPAPSAPCYPTGHSPYQGAPGHYPH